MKTAALAIAVLASFACAAGNAFAQADLRESLKRLDRNDNDQIEPEEITALARPYLENVAKASRMSLSKTYPIERYQKAARLYFATKNGVIDTRIDPDTIPETGMIEFGKMPDEPYIAGFGLPLEAGYPVIDDDIRTAASVLRRYDRNKDGYVDRREAQEAKWTYRDPFESDFDKDDRLSELELQQRFARRRLLSDASAELRQQSTRMRSPGIRKSTDDDSDRSSRDDRRRDPRRSSPDSARYLAGTLMEKFDANRNGRIESSESRNIGLPIAQIDLNRNSEITRDELFEFLAQWQRETVNDDLDGLPPWFFERDENRDEQISMMEFASEWTDEKVNEFMSYDANADGIVTIAEVQSSKALSGGSFRMTTAEVLPPRKTIISEIEVTEDFIVGDLNVEISITHSHDEYLEGFLIGPDGQQVELFTNVGGHDDNFEKTFFDDQSSYPITKMKPPFRGVFQPEALLKRQPGLSHFNGKSIQGVWQLMIRATRSDRFGMLHQWALHVKPQDKMAEGQVAAPMADGPRPEDRKAGNDRDRGDKADRKADAKREAFAAKDRESAIRKAHQERVDKIKQWRDGMVERMKSGQMNEQEAAGFKQKLKRLDDYLESMKDKRDKEIKSIKSQLKESKKDLKR